MRQLVKRAANCGAEAAVCGSQMKTPEIIKMKTVGVLQVSYQSNLIMNLMRRLCVRWGTVEG